MLGPVTTTTHDSGTSAQRYGSQYASLMFSTKLMLRPRLLYTTLSCLPTLSLSYIRSHFCSIYSAELYES